jgi:hypothetical protein
MQMKTSSGGYLYDGVLIEAGTSSTDTEQHISLMELQDIVSTIAEYRNLVAPV